MVKVLQLILVALSITLAASIYMTLYTSGLTRSRGEGAVDMLPFFRSFTPGETAEALLSFLGDQLDGVATYAPTQGCETFRYGTRRGGVLILYYCGRGLEMVTYYPGKEAEIHVEPVKLFSVLGGEDHIIEREEGGFYETVRVYQRVGDVKVLLTGVQLMNELESGRLRKLVLRPLYDLNTFLASVRPNTEQLSSMLESLGLLNGIYRLEGVLVCGRHLGYFYTIYHDSWAYPRYAEASVDIYTGSVLFLNLIQEYGVDRIFGSDCE
ncbi:MAG: hypothetical protein QXI97_00665 [Nitrososphaerota archaeon]